MANWYDHPEYFDMLFRDETAAEVKFFRQAFKRFGRKKTKRLFEPGCGSGRLVVGMAAKGYEVTGLDLSQSMLDYAAKRLKRKGLKATLVKGDMTKFKFKRKFDAAFCTFNTFRHLMTESDAVAHLTAVAKHLRKGGLYILGFHIIPPDASDTCTEKWKAKSGGTKLNATLKVLSFDRKNRAEQLRIRMKATKKSGQVEKIESHFQLRVYTAKQVKQLFAQVPDFEIAEIYDFDYDIDETREFDKDLTDSIFILRKR